MSEPRRLLDEGASSFESRLLRAGRRDAMSRRSRRVIWSGLGLGGLAWSAAALASARHALARMSARGALVSAKVAASGIVTMLAVWGTVSLLRRPASTHTVAPMPAAMRVSSEERVVPAPAPSASTRNSEAAPSAVVAHRPKQARAQSAAQQPSLASEIEALEPARRAVALGSPELALRSLDDYQRRFPRPRLAAEANVLRMEALSLRGDAQAAAALGRRLLTEQPHGPYARRVRSLLAESPSKGTGP